ncbi:MAG: DUF4389 domain-containing protein [Alphaproteobacteria bacterium]|nr:DUF4389 domain-containing protein [Alphaproteobacteria bacterium]
MADDQGISGAQAIPTGQETRPAFPIARLLYAIVFAFAAWFVFWFILLLALVQVVMLALSSRINQELRHFSANLVQYLVELLAYITFMRDEQPFPIGRFPGSAQA